MCLPPLAVSVITNECKRGHWYSNDMLLVTERGTTAVPYLRFGKLGFANTLARREPVHDVATGAGLTSLL